MRIFIITIMLFAASCENPSYVGNTSKDDDEIIYIKDSRTGLCFAERGDFQDYSFTEVPCEKVEKLIK